jgi:hypothetical protein
MRVDIPQDLFHQTKDEDSIVENAVLTIEKFCTVPWVRFGRVILGQKAVGSIQFVNNSNVDEQVVVEKSGKTVSIDQTTFFVPACSSSLTVNVTWIPEQVGGFRDSIQFKIGDRFRLKVITYGMGVEKKVTKKRVFNFQSPTIHFPFLMFFEHF